MKPDMACCVRTAQRGYTLLELAMAIAVIGVTTTVALPMLASSASRSAQAVVLSNLYRARVALRAFALNEHRLPCPDLTGTGREGDANGNCPANAQTGFLPYITLGMDGPAVISGSLAAIRYGVFRQPVSADLVSPNPIASNIDDGAGGFIQALKNASQEGLSQSHPYLPFAGTQDCGSTSSNPAFALSINARSKSQASTGNCFLQDPAGLGDEVSSEGMFELLSLAQQTK